MYKIFGTTLKGDTALDEQVQGAQGQDAAIASKADESVDARSDLYAL